MSEASLFDQPDDDTPMAKKFRSFDREHPEIYKAYCESVDELWNAGCRRFGSQGIFWVVRWKYEVNLKHHEGYKIPNGYSPHYARKYLRDHPHRPDFFETRELKK